MPALTLAGKWKEMVFPCSKGAVHDPETGVDAKILQTVGEASIRTPEGFVSILLTIISDALFEQAMQEIHPRLKRFINSRKKSIESGMNIDWATAEVHFPLSTSGVIFDDSFA